MPQVAWTPSDGDRLPEKPPEDSAKKPDLSLNGSRASDDARHIPLIDLADIFYMFKKRLRADVGVFEKELLFRVGEDSARNLLSFLPPQTIENDPKSVLQNALDLYSSHGYGELRIEKFDPSQNIVEIVCKDSAEALGFQENDDLQREPVCHFTAGALAWTVRVALAPNAPHDIDIAAHESECLAIEGRVCRFTFGPTAQIRQSFPAASISRGPTTEHVLRLNEEILVKNLELQNINLSLERQVRKKTEELWKAEENYNLSMQLSPDPKTLLLMNSRIHSMNVHGLDMLGFESEEEAQTESIASILSGGKETWDKMLWQIEKEGAIRDLEVEIKKKDGSAVNALVSARIADLLPGKCVEMTFRDLTERKKMEQEISEARSESEFLNDLLSHDVMNYAFSALHFLNRLWKSPRISEEDRRDLAQVMKDVQGAYELTSSVRDLSRIKQMGKEEVIIKDLKHLVVEAIEETRRLFPDRVVATNFERSVEPRYVLCTPLGTRLFTNLLTNAVKFDPKEEARIDISVDNMVDGGQAYWRIRISDYGRGIPDDEKERVFERFHRLDTSVPGTGLGLFVARFIAEAGGGRIWAEDRVKGDHAKGTAMVVLMRKAEERDIARMPRKP